MGLSASQSRLLSLTSRLSNLELRAQRISNAKVRLSDQSTEASKAYTEALNKQVMTVANGTDANGNTQYINATAKNLTNSYSDSNVDSKQRFIKDSFGRLIVDSNEAQAYETCGGELATFLNNLAHPQYDTTVPGATAANTALNNLSSAINGAQGVITPSVPASFSQAAQSTMSTLSGYKNRALNNLSNDSTSVSVQYQEMTDLKSALNNLTSGTIVNTVVGQVDAALLKIGQPVYNTGVYQPPTQTIEPTTWCVSVDITNYASGDQTTVQTDNHGNTSTSTAHVAPPSQGYPSTQVMGTLHYDYSKPAATLYTPPPQTVNTNLTATYVTDLRNLINNIDLSSVSSLLVTPGQPAIISDSNVLKTNLEKTNEALDTINNTCGIDVSALKTPIAGYIARMISGEFNGSDIDAAYSTLNSAGSTIDGYRAAMLAKYPPKPASEDYSSSEATAYYTNVFNEIKNNGGMTHLNVQSEANMNSPEWLQNQIDSGTAFLYEKNSSGEFMNVSWDSGDTTLKEKHDSTDTAKAEAEYNTTMSSIQSKEKRMDLELKSIDTEHSATQQEIDSVNKVIQKNIERTMKVFQG